MANEDITTLMGNYYGWRFFDHNRKEDKLYAITQHREFIRGMKSQCAWCNETDSISMYCQCGYYAFYTLEALIKSDYKIRRSKKRSLALIRARGSIIEHSLGFRAQYIDIVDLFLLPPANRSHVSVLKEKYGCRVHRGLWPMDVIKRDYPNTKMITSNLVSIPSSEAL